EGLDRLAPLAPHVLRPAEMKPRPSAGERAASPLGDLERLLGVTEGCLRLSGENGAPGGEHVAPADDLDVPLLARDSPALLCQAVRLLELTQLREKPPLEPVIKRIGATEHDAGAHGWVAVGQLDRAVEDCHSLAVLANAKL